MIKSLSKSYLSQVAQTPYPMHTHKLYQFAGAGFCDNSLYRDWLGKKAFCNYFKPLEIIKDRKDIWLVIIGPGEPEKADRISVDNFVKYEIDSRVRYLRSRDDIPEILSSIDVYALLSWREGFPRSAIEAAAMGLPIVTTDIRGCRQVVENDANGRLVELRNSDQLKDALLKLITNPSLRKKMGEVGYNKAQKEFDEQRVCEVVLETYEECLELIK